MQPDVLIVGGDILGKFVVPIVDHGSGRREAHVPTGQSRHRSTFISVAEEHRFVQKIANEGSYVFRCNRDELALFFREEEYNQQVTQRLQAERLQQWLALADSRLAGTGVKLICNAGNDDDFWVDSILDESESVTRPEGRIVDIGDGFTLLSTGFTNITPWNCPRDVSEDDIARRIAEMANIIGDFSKCIFNFHAPPFGTSLDLAPKLVGLTPQFSLSGPTEEHVGSVAVRAAIERYGPCVSLHGHVHEAHSVDRIGGTICFNPGSEYKSGILRGVFLEFSNGILCRYGLTREGG
jgi:Icc-related predicted phosphoesterase